MARTARNLTRKMVEDALRGKLEAGRRADGLGLYLHVRRGGSAQWVILKMQDGERTEISLGSAMALGQIAAPNTTDVGKIAGASLEAARLKLAEVLVKLNDGASMKGLRKPKVQKEREDWSWEAVAQTYRDRKGPLHDIAERGLVRNIANFKAAQEDDIPAKDIRRIERSHARRWRDARESAGLNPKTIDREMTILRAALNTFYNERDIQVVNPFSGLDIKNKPTNKSGAAKRARLPFTIGEIHALRKVCYETSQTPDLGAMFDVISLTGARLAEVSKLRIEDVLLSHEVPHIRIRPTDERGLKTDGSERLVPVYGQAVVALNEAIERNKATGWVFGRRIGEQNPSSTSAILGKKKDKVTDDKRKAGAHSCRHAISDVLKEALVPKELRDAFTGHVSSDISENTYGSQIAQLRAMDTAMGDVLRRYSNNIINNHDPNLLRTQKTLDDFLE